MFADTRRGHQVEGPGPEPVGGTGECTHRADLDGVAAEVRVEWFPGRNAHLLQRPALEQFDERVTGDLVGEPRAARAQHTTFPVQQHLGGQAERFGERALDIGEAGFGAATGHGLVLQRAFAALIAHRAVQRMVDQQQLHHAVLRGVGNRRGALGAHHHALGDGGGAAGQRLVLPFDLDQALPAGPHRFEQRMVAEPGNLDTDHFSGPDHQGALGNREAGVVDGDGDQLDCRRRSGIGRPRHAPTPSGADSIDA